DNNMNGLSCLLFLGSVASCCLWRAIFHFKISNCHNNNCQLLFFSFLNVKAVNSGGNCHVACGQQASSIESNKDNHANVA
ncbi:hypothetical protein ACJX0J_021279, partial [Zea mays]